MAVRIDEPGHKDGVAKVFDLGACQSSRPSHGDNPPRIQVDHAILDWRGSQRQDDA